MSAGKELFSTKLRELEQEHERIRSRLRLCQLADRHQVRQELDCLTREIDETDAALQMAADTSHSPAVAALSAVQLEYQQRMEAILREKLPRYLHCAATDTASDRAEAAALYAEYAMDFAAQAMRRALQSALAAVELQLDLEETEAAAT
ncbi:hypothetical protein [Dysosmobacter sp.]|uniref:hypothetical protein n=1 Tax=Dysosmobacter sp. TaxID=2591382 RepID=UPI002A90216B|nr:hypothetical protein [Dysosmobacter sp.]MDY3282173.1 hypothetical protein [Dysosmobacter sp.]